MFAKKEMLELGFAELAEINVLSFMNVHQAEDK